MAATLGFRHCFVTKDEVDSKVKDWEKSGKTPAWIEERVSAVHDYILPNDTVMGMLAKIAKHTYNLDNGWQITLCLIAVHEAFNPKAGTKWLCLFSQLGIM